MHHYEDPRAASIEALKIVQKARGWVPDGAADAIGAILGIPASDVEGVAPFYSQIFRQPVLCLLPVLLHRPQHRPLQQPAAQPVPAVPALFPVAAADLEQPVGVEAAPDAGHAMGVLPEGRGYLVEQDCLELIQWQAAGAHHLCNVRVLEGLQLGVQPQLGQSQPERFACHPCGPSRKSRVRCAAASGSSCMKQWPPGTTRALTCGLIAHQRATERATKG